MPYIFVDRIIEEGVYFCKNKSTVRKTASHFGLSKSCVHKDLTVKLKVIDKELFKQVKELLTANLNERHIRGGIATKNKYKKIQKSR